MSLAIALLLTCTACSQEDAPAEDIAQAAEEIVDPAPEPAPLAKGKWAPRDECGDLEGAEGFRTRLAAAVRRRDADALVALSAEDIELDFGGGSGGAELRRRLAGSPTEPSLWQAFDLTLPLGCAANEQGGITIPWVFEQGWGDADPYGSMLVLGEDVPVLAKPDPSAERVALVSWDLVEVNPLEGHRGDSRVELPDGTAGFIASNKLRSLIDYRLTASNRNGRWRITSFVAGD
jgi:hypothetical protein